MESEQSTASFGYWVRRRRQALDLTQAELARRIGCATVTISKIERDERRPSRQMAKLLAEQLSVADEKRTDFLAAARGDRSVDRLSLTDQPIAANEEHPDERSVLPAQLTPLVGREREQSEAHRLLQAREIRLLTIVGTGGFGKTRLALAVAEAQVKNFADGVYFVPLESLEEPQAIVSATAESLGLPFHSESAPRRQLLHFLREKTLLLVLDNFEHLLEGAELVYEMLQTAPGVVIIITSRQPLNLSGETLFPLEGLDTPRGEDEAEKSSRNLASYSAVALFLQSARRIRPNFEPADDDWQAIARISRLVEGAPLGLILAAGWVSLLSVEEIEIELRRSLDVLENELVDLPQRQRSMRAVFDYTWSLLSDTERTVFRNLAILRGGFDREAGLAVAGATLPTLNSLANRGLIRQTETGRFELHPLLRQYAREKLKEELDKYEDVQERHATFYTDRLLALKADLWGRGQQAALDTIEVDLRNIETAWARTARNQRIDILSDTLDVLFEFFWIRCRYEEGDHLFQQIEANLNPPIYESGSIPSPIHIFISRLRCRRSWFVEYLARHDEARSLIQASLQIARVAQDRRTIVLCLVAPSILGGWAKMGNAVAAHLQEARQIAEHLHDDLLLGHTLERLGFYQTTRGDYPNARSLFEQSLTHYREIDYQPGIASSLDKVALILWTIGKVPQAEEYWQESLTISRQMGDLFGEIRAIGGLAQVAWSRAGPKLVDAQRLQAEALALSRQIGFGSGTAWRLMVAGDIANQLGDPERAQDLLHEAQRICEQAHFVSGHSVAHSFLGETMSQTGRYLEARQHIQQALSLADDSGNVPESLLGLVHGAILLLTVRTKKHVMEGPIAEELVPIVELLAFAVQHPGNRHIFQERARHHLEIVRGKLSADTWQAARARGEAMTLEMATATLASLLAVI